MCVSKLKTSVKYKHSFNCLLCFASLAKFLFQSLENKRLHINTNHNGEKRKKTKESKKVKEKLTARPMSTLSTGSSSTHRSKILSKYEQEVK